MYTDIYIYICGGNIISCIHIYYTRIFMYTSLINHFIIALFFFFWGGGGAERVLPVALPYWSLRGQDAGASSFQRSYHLRCSYSSSRLQAPSEKNQREKTCRPAQRLDGYWRVCQLNCCGLAGAPRRSARRCICMPQGKRKVKILLA